MYEVYMILSILFRQMEKLLLGMTFWNLLEETWKQRKAARVSDIGVLQRKTNEYYDRIPLKE